MSILAIFENMKLAVKQCYQILLDFKVPKLKEIV